jgi:transposase
MSISSLLPASDRLHLLSVAADGEGITLTARTCSDVACCPLCGRPSSRIHSRYRRILADLPWQGIPARVLLWARRFFCDAPDCVRRIFTERLPGVALPYAHRTDRLRDWFTHVSSALGGEAGGRLLRALGVPVSGETLLAHIRAAAAHTPPTPRVLSVDDFALRRGRAYGSILVDLESHRVVRVPSGWHLTRSERRDLRGVARGTPGRGDHQPRSKRRVRGGSAACRPGRHPSR